MVLYFGTSTKVWIFGEEIGESGTPHLQGYVEFTTKTRPVSTTRPWSQKCHWTKCKGTQLDNVKYCTKEGGTIRKSHGLRIPRPTVRVTEDKLRPQQKAVTDLFKEVAEPGDRLVHWFWERTGNWGKTHMAKFLIDQYQTDKGISVIQTAGKGADMKYQIAKYIEDSGEGPDLVIVDVPRCNIEYVSYGGIEEIKNGLLASSKYESCCCRFNEPHVAVFANAPPDYEKMSADRWHVVELPDRV